MYRTYLSLAVLIFVSAVASSVAQEAATPGWVLYERGERARREGRLAEALRRYSEALRVRPVYPEAQLGTARVYRAGGDGLLAERYYRRAVEQAAALAIPDEVFRIESELAGLLRDGNRQDEAIAILQRLTARDPIFGRRDNLGQRDAMVALLFSGGLDRVLVLYRLNFPQALDAHKQLGDYYLSFPQPEAYERAAEHLLFAVVEVTSRAIRAVIERDVGYEFATLQSFLNVARTYPEVNAYLRKYELRALLLGLAVALDEIPAPNAALRAGEIRAAVVASGL